MTINCGVCGGIIPSHTIDVKHGSHYSEHYEPEEHILHADLGKILEIGMTNELNKRLDEIQIKKEPEIVKNAFYQILLKKECVFGISVLHTIEDIKSQISDLHAVIREAEHNKIIIKSGEERDSGFCEASGFGRHQNYHWNRLYIPNIDVCVKCFKWFEKDVMSLGSLNMVIPGLKLSDLNKDIWNEIMNVNVKIKLKDW